MWRLGRRILQLRGDCFVIIIIFKDTLLGALLPLLTETVFLERTGNVGREREKGPRLDSPGDTSSVCRTLLWSSSHVPLRRMES